MTIIVITMILTRLTAKSSGFGTKQDAILAYVSIGPAVRKKSHRFHGLTRIRTFSSSVLIRVHLWLNFLLELERETATELSWRTHVRAAENRLEIIEKQLVC